VKGYGQPAAEMRRNPRDIFAGVLSLFWPGLGHFYKGHVRMAAVLAALGVLCFLWAITFLMFLGFLVFPAYWFGVALNAYFLEDWKHKDAPRGTVLTPPQPRHA
jgi:TM2 domain-containing membrane protein YozV